MPKAKKKEPEKLMEGSDALVLMHTALRKLCDSPITSAAYSLIHLLTGGQFRVPDEVNTWLILGELVAKHVNSPARARAERETWGVNSLRLAFREFDGKFDEAARKYRESGESLPDGARSAHGALYCVMRCFDDDDWRGMAGYLMDES